MNDTTTRGIFVGDATASSLLNTLRSVAFSQVAGLPEDDYSYLTQIGISFDAETGLSISDSTKLENAINDETSQVAALFNSDNGIAANLYDFVDGYLGSDGIIANITKNYDDNISYLSDRITATGERIQKSADVLRARYEALQTELATLMSSQSYFSESLNLFG